MFTARPHTFAPELAQSLWVHADLLGDAGDPAAAVPLLVEAAILITPFARRLPTAHGPLADGIRDSYLSACAAAGTPPDPTLLPEA